MAWLLPFATVGVALAFLMQRGKNAAKRAEKDWRETFDATPDLITILDPDFRILRANQAMADRLKSTPSRLVGRKCYECVHARGAPSDACPHKRCIEDGKQHTGEFHDSDADFLVTCTPLFDERGRLKGSVHVARDITTRKKAEEAAEAERTILQAVMDGAPNAHLVYLDSEFNFVRVNQAYARTCGYRPEEMIGKNHFALYPHPENEAIFRRVRDTGVPVQFQDRPFEFPDQPERGVTYWDWTLNPLRGVDGSTTGLIFALTETTERKRAQAALEAERARWKSVVEGIADEVWVCDALGRMSLINLPEVTAMGLAEFHERSVDEVLTEVDIYIPDGTLRPAHDAPLLRSLRTGAVVRGEEIMQHRATGRRRNRQFSSAPIRDPAGAITGAVAIVRDVTDVRRAEAALRDSERNYRIVADNTYDWEFWMSPENKYLYVSPSCLRWTGYEAQEFLTDPALFDRILHPDDGPAYDERHCRGQACATEEMEFRIVRRDGEIRWISHACTPVYDESGNFLGVRGSNRDITERKQTEEALKEADQRKDQFLAMLAHELRNPMSTISAAASLLRRMALPAQAETARAALERQTKQLGKLVDDLLDISRITRGKVSLAKEHVELREPFSRAVELTRPVIDQAGHTLSLHFAEEPLPVYGDPLRLQQIFTNLLSNAARYTKPGGEIAVRAWRAGAAAFISVKDNGIGIEHALQEKIFEPFMQIDPGISRSKGGLGIGLAIVKQLTALHGGSVSVQTDGPGKGAAFTVSLPLEIARPSRHESMPAPLRAGLKFLVVDDNRDAAVLTAALLEDAGHAAKIAYDGESAIELALQTIPDAMLLDIGLPGLDGYEVARRLRAAGLKDMAIVAVTGYGQDRDRAMSREAGFDDHLLKPFHYEALAAILAEWQNNGRAGRVKALRQEKSPEHWQ